MKADWLTERLHDHFSYKYFSFPPIILFYQKIPEDDLLKPKRFNVDFQLL